MMQREMQVLELVQLLGLVWVQPRYHRWRLHSLLHKAAGLGADPGTIFVRATDEEILAGLRQMMEDDICAK
jgi:hypothetical protein